MNTFKHGRMAAAIGCLWLAACGGGGDGGGTPPPAKPVTLPDSVKIAGTPKATPGQPASFGQDVGMPTTGVTFAWNYGDGTTGTGASVQHTYATPGDYVVTMTATNSAGDSRSATRTVNVRQYGNTYAQSCTLSDFAGWCWQDMHTTPHKIRKWFFLDATHGWGVGEEGTVVFTSNGGLSWLVGVSGTTDILMDVRFRDLQHGIATANGGLLQTDNGGITWTRNEVGGLLPAGGYQTAIVRHDAGAIVLAHFDSDNAKSVTLASHDGGATWTSVPMIRPFVVGDDCWALMRFVAGRSAGCSAPVASVLPGPLTPNLPSLVTAAATSASDVLVLGQTYGTGPNAGWATTDGGATWSAFTPDGLPPLFSGELKRLDDQRAWLVNGFTDQWGVFDGQNITSAYYSADAGRTWAAVAPPADIAAVAGGSNFLVFDVLPANGRLWFAAGNRLASTLDAGLTWQEVQVPAESPAFDYLMQGRNLTVVSWPDANDIVVSADGRLYVTADGGKTWVQPVGPDARDADNFYTALAFTDGTHGAMAMGDGSVKTTADGGQTWTRHDVATPQDMPVALHFSSASQGLMVMAGTLWGSADAGAHWSPVLTSPLMPGLLGMAWIDASHAWTWSATAIYATADGGSTWAATGRPAGGAAIAAVAFSSASTGVLFDENNVMLRTVDGGSTWTAVTGPGFAGRLAHTRGHVLWSMSDTLSRSTDDGATWTAIPMPPNTFGFTDIAFSDDQHGWMSAYGSVLQTSDGGSTWTAIDLGSDTWGSTLFVVDPYTAWIATPGGALLATSTGGR